jgi:hypothetical protein
MRKIIYLPLFLVLLSSCFGFGGRRVRGNGNLGTQTRNAGAFEGIRVLGGMDVVLSSGSDYAVKVEADANLLQYILTEKDGDDLVIKTRNNYNLNPRAGMKVYITAPSLETIKITGSGSVLSQSKVSSNGRLDIDVTGSGDVKLDLAAPEVEADATGSGNIILSGTTRNFKGEINGSGELHCFGLMSENTDVEISGSGSAEVFASKRLDVRISGSGDVAYKGTPTINQRISGSGDVRSAQ